MNPAFTFGLGGAALAASLTLNWWLRELARRHDWCDPAAEDDASLKIHAKPTPFTGGLGIAAVFVAGLALLAGRPAASVAPLAVGAVALLALAVGTWDDFRWKTMSAPLPKLALQTVAAAGSAVCLRSPLAALLVLGAMNAYNLADGIDGLAAGEAAISAVALGLVFTGHGQRELSLVALLFAGALAGFLLLNWHPAKLFLGDGGSHLAGATLAGLASLAAGLRPGLSGLVGALLILGLPVVDAGWVIGCRLAQRRPLFAGDRCHLYDIINRRLSTRPTVVALWSLHAVLVLCGAAILCR